jgi:hypothetical protein
MSSDNGLPAAVSVIPIMVCAGAVSTLSIDGNIGFVSTRKVAFRSGIKQVEVAEMQIVWLSQRNAINAEIPTAACLGTARLSMTRLLLAIGLPRVPLVGT